jgi:hypothetical protein
MKLSDKLDFNVRKKGSFASFYLIKFAKRVEEFEVPTIELGRNMEAFEPNRMRFATL